MKTCPHCNEPMINAGGGDGEYCGRCDHWNDGVCDCAGCIEQRNPGMVLASKTKIRKPATYFQKEQILAWFANYMSPETRSALMHDLPQAYNAWQGVDCAEVRYADGRGERPTKPAKFSC